jgi:hypothetical protein
MKIVAQHRIIDPEKFSSMDSQDVADGAPPGVELRQFFPSEDASAAICLWEADSLDAVRNYVDAATAGVTENTYFEVDGQRAVGLPESAAAGA